MKKLTVFACVMLLCGTAWATKYWIPTGPGDYANPANWTDGVIPGFGDTSGVIATGGTATLDADLREIEGVLINLRSLYVQNSSTLELDEGAFLDGDNWSTLGLGRTAQTSAPAGPGTFIVRGGTISFRDLIIGHSGDPQDLSVIEYYGGTLGATVTVGRDTKGEFHMREGNLELGPLHIGKNASGEGLFIQYPGTSVSIGANGTFGDLGTGTYLLQDGFFASTDGYRTNTVGGPGGGYGEVIQENGTVEHNSHVSIGTGEGSTGLWQINAGSFATRGLRLGYGGGTGTLQVVGTTPTSIQIGPTFGTGKFVYFYEQYAGGVLRFDIGSDGVTPIELIAGGTWDVLFEAGATLDLRVLPGHYIPKDAVFTLMTISENGTLVNNGLQLAAESAEEWEFFFENDNVLKARYTGLRPEITEFTVTGDTGSELFTRTQQVNVVLSANPSNPEGEIAGWMVTDIDYTEPPAVDDPAWEDFSPTSFSVLDLPGTTFTLYAWVIDSDGQTSNAVATIYYEPQDPVISNVQIVPDAELIEALITWDTDVAAYGNISYTYAGYDWMGTEFVGPTTTHSATMYMGLPDEQHDIIIRSNATVLEIVWPEPVVVYPTGDADQNCMVDLLDLVYVRNQLFAEIDENNATADVNEDETIDLNDLIEVRNNLGAECEEPE